VLVFVSGAVRSGKSTAAERLAEQIAGQDGRHIYIATAAITDEEMQRRVSLHQLGRIKSAAGWETIEVTGNMENKIEGLRDKDIVLLDCATNWLANELFAAEEKWMDEAFCRKVMERMKKAVTDINGRVRYFIIVSNDLFEDGVLHGPVFVYMKLLGEFHQWLVEQADAAIAAEAGIMVAKKGAWETEWREI
jgi:adenosylcobinamide kinase/adenosylcobinamide-phosphate guanylyltransferase